MASLQLPISPQLSPNYILPSNSAGLLHVEERYKSHIAENLETLLIGHPTQTKWPESLKEVISDTILRGRYKYLDENNRVHRVVYHSTLTIGTPFHALPTQPEENDPFEQKRRFCVFHAVRSALHFLNSCQGFTDDSSLCNRLLIEASQFRQEFNPSAPNSLGAVSDVILDVVTLSTRPVVQIVDVLITAITGVPCVLPHHLPAGVGKNHADSKMIFHHIIYTVALHLSEACNRKNVEPGNRWKLTHMSRLSYLQKILLQSHDQCYFTLDMLYILSKLDVCHAVVESGIAFKAHRKKICYAAPLSLTLFLTTAIADVVVTEDEFRLRDQRIEGDSSQRKRFLLDDDYNDMQKNRPTVQYGEWTSVSHQDFTPKTLADFVTREERNKIRIATNAHGDVLFYVDFKGPWHRPTDLTIRFETHQEFMQGTVHGYPVENHVPFWFQKHAETKRPTTVNDSSAASALASGVPFETVSYKPKTLNAVVNRPGRVLVKRKGLRGSGGRFIMTGIMALGILSVVFNFANRDNWLEIAFDGAQVMSLVAGLAVAVVYIVNGTLTSTLDWLSGQTEVTDEDQLARVLGVTLDEIKAACTYENEFLFWLSEVNSSFCPAGKYGTIMFSDPFDMEKADQLVNHCSVLDEERGLWLLQGWAFAIEVDGDIGLMKKVPHEDRVYVDRRGVTKFGGR